MPINAIAMALVLAEPAAAQEPNTPDIFVVTFPSNGATISGDAVPILDNVAAAWHQHRNKMISIKGHADRVGSQKWNLRLSKRRADEVKAYLVGRGLPDRFIFVTAYGEAKPVVPTPDGASEARNRRVEVWLEFQSQP